MKEYDARGLSNTEVKIAYTIIDNLQRVLEQTPYCVKHMCYNCEHERFCKQISMIHLDITYEMERLERGERNGRE